jgi:hypothetical protein
MSSLKEFSLAIGPVGLGIVFFVVAFIVVESTIVKRRLFSNYQLKAIDFIWACVTAFSLVISLCSARESRLAERIGSLEHDADSIRNTVLARIGEAPDDCMAGTWPPGAVKGKSYQENGNMVREDCRGVSVVSDWSMGFFAETSVLERLWSEGPSKENAAAFSAKFQERYGPNAAEELVRNMNSQGPLDKLALAAFKYYSSQAKEIVQEKQAAARLASEKSIVHWVATHSSFWPFLLSFGLALALGKAHRELLDARRKEIDV